MNAKKMIKAVILGMAAVAVLSAAGCSDGNKVPTQGAVQKESPLMQKIKKQGKLVVGTASGYPPYEFIDTSVGEKKVIGIDMALAQKIADELGVKLEVQDMNFQALLTSLTGGKVDIAIAGINPTEERKKSMDFSADYLPTEQKVIIRKEDGSRYKKLEDLFGKTVGVQKSTTQEALAKEKIKDTKIVSLAHVPEVVLELKQGKVDGLVVEGIVGGQYLVFNDDLMFSEVEFPNSVKSSAAAVQKGNEDVVAVVNKVIKENTDNGNFKKWTDEYSRKAVENADKQ
jgi:ABC-type amino acid transport substrate-binding protein